MSDWALLLENWPAIWRGLLVTIALSAVVLLASTPLALLLALARDSRQVWLSWASAIYVTVFRALPALIILYFTFYALPQFGMSLPPFWAAVVGLVLASSAYLSEDIRAGLVAVSRGQWQAATALGLDPWRVVFRIILPQAMPIIIPTYITRAIIIVKGTSLASIVAVRELTGVAFGLTSIHYRPFGFLLAAAALYLALTGILAIVQAGLERAFESPASRKPRPVSGLGA